MKQHTKLKKPYNASVHISFDDNGKNEDVTFSYSQKLSKKNDWNAYAGHMLFNYMGIFTFILIYVWQLRIISKWFPTYTDWTWYFPHALFTESQIAAIVVIYMVLSMLLIGYGSIRFWQGISVLIHHNSAKMRELYPKTNALTRKWYTKLFGKKMGFSPTQSPRFSKHHVTLSPTQLLITDYDVVYQRFSLEPDCARKIKNIETINIANDLDKKDVQVMDFYLLFTFNSPPNDFIILTTNNA